MSVVKRGTYARFCGMYLQTFPTLFVSCFPFYGILFVCVQEMDTVMRSQAVVSAAQNNVTASASNDEARSYAQELALEENQVDPCE